MPDTGKILYDSSALLCSLFILERSADILIDHAVILSRRTNIPQSAIALLTAGAEWEELVVIVVSLINHRPGLAVGNIIGSVIANILGAFSLGLIIYNPSDDSAQSSSIESGSRVYALLLLVITAVCSMLCVIRERLSRTIVGVFLICAFAGYIISLSVLISRGLARKPEELSDSDSDSDTSSSHSVDHEEEASVQGARPGYGTIDRQDSGSFHAPTSRTRLVSRSPKRKGITRNIVLLLVGLIGIILSGFVLSSAVANLVDAFGISDILGGVVILSIATTFPEKFVAVISGNKGHLDIMLANTVGSNLFLLTLCLGVVWLGSEAGGGMAIWEVLVMLGSTAALAVTILLPAKSYRLVGLIMLVSYIAFIVAEFKVPH